MRLRLGLLAALTAALIPLVALTTGGAATAAPPPAATAPTVNITPAQSGGVLNGVFTLTGFTVNQAGQLVANGTFTGTATDALGVVTPLTNAVVSSVVTAAPAAGGSCQILDLVLGPLHLDLLGLVVDLNQVHLTITAQQGPGNLLGNLLCAVAGLLNNTGGANTGALQQIVNLLNQILAGL